jgi:hypothetical protein
MEYLIWNESKLGGWILDTGYWILDIGCSIQDTG